MSGRLGDVLLTIIAYNLEGVDFHHLKSDFNSYFTITVLGRHLTKMLHIKVTFN